MAVVKVITFNVMVLWGKLQRLTGASVKIMFKNMLLVIVKTRDLEKYSQLLLIGNIHPIGLKQKQSNKTKIRKPYSLYYRSASLSKENAKS